MTRKKNDNRNDNRNDNYPIASTDIWDLYDSFEDAAAAYRELNEVPADEDIKDQEIFDWLSETTNIYWKDFEADIKHADRESYDRWDHWDRWDYWIITGTLGLWHGQVSIYAIGTSSVMEAIEEMWKGSIDDIKIEETRRGKVIIKAMHHDGTNIFTLHRLSKQGKERFKSCNNRQGQSISEMATWLAENPRNLRNGRLREYLQYA
jgi:hypothetical protein